MCRASRTPQTTVIASSSQRRRSSPWPADATKLATATQQNSSPHATSMTLWRWTRLATAYVMTSVAAIDAAAQINACVNAAAEIPLMRRRPACA